MTVTYQIDDNRYLLGWYSDPAGVELSDVFAESSDLVDQYGNPAWQLAADGVTVSATNITTTDDQVAAYNLKYAPTLAQQKASSIAAALPAILQQLLSGPTPTDPWVVAFLAALNNA